MQLHYCDVVMGAVASQITSLTTVYSTVYSDADQRKHQSSASLAFVRGIHRRPVNSPHKWPVMPPSHCRDFGLRTNMNWHSLRIAQHRIDSNYFVLVRCHFRISSQANTNVLKCSKHSYWPCESKPFLLRRIASPNVVSIRVSSYWFVSHRWTFVSIRCTFALGFAAWLLRLSTLQYDAQRPHCRIGSHMFALVRVSSY